MRDRQYRRQQHAVTAIARADVPQTRVTAEPGRTELARELLRSGDPRGLEVVALFQIEVEEVVRGRHACAHEGERSGIDAALEIDAYFEELHQIGAIAVQRQRIEAVFRRSELGRGPEAETRKPGDARAKSGLGVVEQARARFRTAQPFTEQEKNADSSSRSTAWNFCQNSVSTDFRCGDVSTLR